jgi:MSHA pilin protein MshD
VSSPSRCSGVTLVELVVTIVVVGIAVAAVLAVTSATAASGTNNLLQTQAVAIGESYLNEILQKPLGYDCAPTCTRAQMDEAGDYGGLVDVGVHDQTGAAVLPLAAYTVQVRVANSTLGTPPQTVPADLITVTVSSPNGQSIALSGYRTQYP